MNVSLSELRPADATRGSGVEDSFFDAYTDDLYALFVALDREHEWRDNPKGMLPYTQAKWVGVEHGASTEKDRFDHDQEAAALELMPQLDLAQEIRPEAGNYEQIILAGGMTRVLRERTEFMKCMLANDGIVSADEVVFWTGQRLRDARDDARIDLIDMGRLADLDAWVSGELAKPTEHGWQSQFATENEISRLVYVEAFGPAEPHSVTVPNRARITPIEGVPARDVTSYTFKSDSYPDVTIMNCAAVQRSAGQPRPTTESCAVEWLEDHAPGPDAQVLLIAGNPHMLRTLRMVRGTLVEGGRADLSLSVCGPAADTEASVQLYLGEIGRLIYMDAEAEVNDSY